MNKKFGALFVMAIFLLSMIPLAFAAQEPVLTKNKVRAIEPMPVPALIREEVREEVKEIIREGRESNTSIREVSKEIRTTVKERVGKHLEERREITKEKLEATKEKYQAAKEHYNTVRDRYMNQKSKFQDAKENYNACKDSDSEDCEAKRNEIRNQAKPHLVNAADLVLKELEKIKSKVESSEDLSEEEIAEIVSDIEDKISEVESAKEVIENLDEDSTNEEINEAAKTIRESWQRAKTVLKKHVARMANAQLGNIIHRTEILEKRLYNTRDNLEKKGIDTSNIDAMLDEFSANLDTAADKYIEARELWSDANTPGEVDDVAKQIQELLREAKAALNDARDSLREIVKEIKQANNGSLEVESDATEDDSSDDETENNAEVEEQEDEEV